MGKPKAPAVPDYAAAAKQQGAANINSAVASNYLNQVNQNGPNGSLNFSYDYEGGYTDPQTGQRIPRVTANTTLSPEQQKLYDQNTGLSISLNDIAKQGLDYVKQVSNKPVDLNSLPALQTGDSAVKGVTDALMARLQPSIDRDRVALDSKLANQGISIGSDAYKTAQDLQGQRENDARSQAIVQGFNSGIASGQMTNQARQQALQEQDYQRNAPLNMLNALRTGNQVQGPQFSNVAGGAQAQAAPVYAATNDAYQGALNRYNSQLQGYSGLLGGLGSLGGAALFKFSDRRLKQNIERLFETASGLGVYAFNYIWSKVLEIGFMADEVEKIYPSAVGYNDEGFAFVDYSKVR